MNNSIQHVFFDLDHTLWDFDKNSKLAYEKIFDKYSINESIDGFLKVYQPINMKYWRLYREEKVTKKELRRGRLIEAFNGLGVSFKNNVIDQIADDYIDFLPLNNYLIDGAKELLEFMAPKYELHIITNGFREVQNAKLVNSGIDKYFRTVTNSEDAGVKKPNPLIFEQAMIKAKVQSKHCLMIGDSYEADIVGAEQLGWKTICFNYHKVELPERNIQVSQLSQIKSIMDTMV